MVLKIKIPNYVMSELQESAFRRYANGDSYESIRKDLGISKVKVIQMVRAQGEKFLEMVDSEKEPETEVIQPQSMVMPEPLPLSYQRQPQQLSVEPHAQHGFELELTAVDKKLTMTGYEILIYDIFCNNGYTGSFSDFCREAIQVLYSRTTPQGRAM